MPFARTSGSGHGYFPAPSSLWQNFSVEDRHLILHLLPSLPSLPLAYYHFASYRDPTSYFFNPLRAFERRYSSRRITEAEEFLRVAGTIDQPTRLQNGVPTICVGIATVRRRGEQYVGLTVASLLAGLTEAERASIFLNILIGNAEPSQHPIYSERWIETLPGRVLTYRQNDPDLERIKNGEEDGWYRNKTIYDYTRLLQDCYSTGAQYVAIIEDDTLAVKGWLPSVLQALDGVEQRTANGRWIYLRLFYVEDLLGWNSEE
ncbi:Glycosyl transferase, family 54 [Penicillium griseofulvum]|uniref:Glycosyl transferase, family 54 n=1 Tax=Penicillium patulum TaxID=5078 RepID=A0A135LWS7_PENPA|nr:Glycosyl transferase, family 54 [Penicillium griseofulvum]KXG53417.1 Glycosyl transferase, family 54 [Penicillium griseofulvum]